jgi:hypothetical protein
LWAGMPLDLELKSFKHKKIEKVLELEEVLEL